jgi:hypothetical protein
MRSQRGRCFKTLIYRYFGGMKGLLLTLQKRRLFKSVLAIDERQTENLKVYQRRDQELEKTF